MSMRVDEEILNKAKALWGNDLHNDKSAPIHCSQLEDVFEQEWVDAMHGHLLEIGCGSGSDLTVFSANPSIASITAIDLGSNVHALAEKYSLRADITIKNGNALALEFERGYFDVVYSYGVLHHTSDPIKGIEEAKRVLKVDGKLFLYLYGTHEDIWFKRIGVIFEKALMLIFKILPYNLQSTICILLSPICWLLFSLPAIFLRLIGAKEFAAKIPFYFGTHPFSLIGDLKDRLLSPVNHRFTKVQMEAILLSVGFTNFQVIKKPSGLYIFAKNLES